MTAPLGYVLVRSIGGAVEVEDDEGQLFATIELAAAAGFYDRDGPIEFAVAAVVPLGRVEP